MNGAITKGPRKTVRATISKFCLKFKCTLIKYLFNENFSVSNAYTPLVGELNYPYTAVVTFEFPPLSKPYVFNSPDDLISHMKHSNYLEKVFMKAPARTRKPYQFSISDFQKDVRGVLCVPTNMFRVIIKKICVNCT